MMETKKSEEMQPSSDNAENVVQKRRRGRPPGKAKGRPGPKRRPGCVPMGKRLSHKKQHKSLPSNSSSAQERSLQNDGKMSDYPKEVVSEHGIEGVSTNSADKGTSIEQRILMETTSNDNSQRLSGSDHTCNTSKHQYSSTGASSGGMQSVLSSDNFHDYATPPSPVAFPSNAPFEHRLLSASQTPSTSHLLPSASHQLPTASRDLPSTDGHCPYDLLSEVASKVQCFLYARWHTIIKQNAVSVVLMSAHDNFSMQRNIVFWPSGKVDLFVHCEPVDVNQFLKNTPTRVPLNENSANKFVDRIVKIVDEVRKMEVCSGYDNENVKAGWGMCTLGKIDTNPFKECRYNETFRSFNCLQLVKRNAWRCCECAKLYKPLKGRAQCATQTNPHPNIANIHLANEQKLLKLHNQATKLENARKQIYRLREKVRSLIEKEAVKIDSDLSDSFMEILNTNSITPAQSIFLQEQIKASRQKNSVGMRWHPTMIRLNLSLYVTSPVAYEMLRDTGMVKLPSSRTLFDYGHVKPTSEGVDPVVIDSLGEKIKKFKHPYQKYHVLMADEMYISQNLVFQKSNGRMVGYVNLDCVDREVEAFENYLNGISEDEQEPPIATKVLVYMIKGVSSGLKEVVATYAVANMSVEQMYFWTWEVIGALERTGIAVIAFVTDGFSVNRAFIKKHEPVNILPNGVVFDTINKAAPDRGLYFLSDVPHLLKTIRNCLYSSRAKNKEKGRRMMRKGRLITWDPIIRLYEKCKNKNLRKSFKLNAMNVFPDGYARMKVKYAGQILSKTVAQDLENQKWEGTSELVHFIRFVNDWFDCLNGAHTSVGKKKRNEKLLAYKSQDDERFDFLLSFVDYLEEWSAEANDINDSMNATEQSRLEMTAVVDQDHSVMDAVEEGVDPSDDNTSASNKILSRQTIEGIETSTRAFISMVKFLLKEGTQFINARIFTQDPLEQHFSKVRAGQGGSTNPNLGQVLNRNRALHTVGELGIKRRRGNHAQNTATVEVKNEPLPKRRCVRTLKV